jgi:hypothetical protein
MAAVDTSIQEIESPPYFAVSIWKFVLMTVATMGLYLIYWNYRQWSIIKARSGESMWPIARAIFYPITCFDLAKRVHESASTIGTSCSWSSWMIAVPVLSLNIVAWFREIADVPILGYAHLLHVVPLGFAQFTINKILSQESPNHDRNSRLTKWNIVWLVLVSVLMLLAWIGGNQPQK